MSDGGPSRVLCGESELQEYGEVLRVGDQVRRQAGRREGVFFGSDLDDVQWRFDRYAQFVGYDAAIISGRVTAIDAVFVRLQQSDRGWQPELGSAHLEPVGSTADTRIIPDEIVWAQSSPAARDGGYWVTGTPMYREGDEHFSSWLITLTETSITPLPREKT